MNDRLPGALAVSLMLHAAAAGLMFLFNYAAELSQRETTKVFELVAGEGDNFAALAAPALGEPGGIKVDVPELPSAQPEPPKAVEAPPPEPVPVAPAPVPKPPEKTTPKAPPDPNLNFSQKLKKAVIRADANAKRAVAKEREAEAKRLSKEEFDRLNKKNAKSPNPPTKIAKAETEGIKKGVVGGSTENKTGGAGGKALTREDGPVMEAYFALLKDRLRKALEKPPGLSDTLVTMVQVHLAADGTLSGARITKSSGSAEFDQAALAAVKATRMPARPDGKSEVIDTQFRMKEPEQN